MATMAWPEHGFIESGDVVVTVEHCHECHGHRMTTRHDPEVKRYNWRWELERAT